jgi:hypothetical protein
MNMMSMKTYILNPNMTLPTVFTTSPPCKPAPAALPPRQPLPTAVLRPERSAIKLGLDVHLEFIMAVAQRDHASPQSPRKFMPEELVAQVRKWVAEGLSVYASGTGEVWLLLLRWVRVRRCSERHFCVVRKQGRIPRGPPRSINLNRRTRR